MIILWLWVFKSSLRYTNTKHLRIHNTEILNIWCMSSGKFIRVLTYQRVARRKFCYSFFAFGFFNVNSNLCIFNFTSLFLKIQSFIIYSFPHRPAFVEWSFFLLIGGKFFLTPISRERKGILMPNTFSYRCRSPPFQCGHSVEVKNH